MLKIRFQKLGRKNQPKYRLVAIDDRMRSKRGKAREILGWWDPLKKNGSFNAERVKYWLSVGAQISDTAWNLLIANAVITGKKRAVKLRKKKAEEKKEAPAEALKEAAAK